jgi:hypothetical protein
VGFAPFLLPDKKPMPKRLEQKIFQWRITRTRSTPAALIGHVQAPDAEQAIKEAIREFGITEATGGAAGERNRLSVSVDRVRAANSAAPSMVSRTPAPVLNHRRSP